MSYTVFVNLRL